MPNKAIEKLVKAGIAIIGSIFAGIFLGNAAANHNEKKRREKSDQMDIERDRKIREDL